MNAAASNHNLQFHSLQWIIRFVWYDLRFLGDVIVRPLYIHKNRGRNGRLSWFESDRSNRIPKTSLTHTNNWWCSNLRKNNSRKYKLLMTFLRTDFSGHVQKHRSKAECRFHWILTSSIFWHTKRPPNTFIIKRVTNARSQLTFNLLYYWTLFSLFLYFSQFRSLNNFSGKKLRNNYKSKL